MLCSEYTEAAKLHIEEIRSQKFSIGKKESNPLTQDLHHAVTSLSAELYTKDVHFLMELIQNAEDNEYEKSVEPTLEFILTKEDITGNGAPATLLIFNNEVGFSKKNMESLCSVGRSTKKGKRQQGFIGEKGIGFKSVFLVSQQPYVYSNGYRIRFREEPDPDCGIGYIVPEWVWGKPLLSDIFDIYGSNMRLPTTIFILPLKPEKVEAVKMQLSELHPEILLFLSKVKRLYVRENEREPVQNDNVTVVSIASETNHVKLSSKGADSRVVQLSVKERTCDAEETCKYFMWRQAFPVKSQNRVSSRVDVEQWSITLAFPFGNRLRRGTSSVGVFAFLPTAMVTNFPFVIQADFILASSRESILLDSLWNLGILECVPTAFVNAFLACLEQNSLFSSMGQVFEFLPAQASSYPELNKIRESIRNQLRNMSIVPYELFDGRKYLANPKAVVRILPKFRLLLFQIKKKGASLHGLYKLKKVLHSSLDHQKYTPILDFLGVVYADPCRDWYAKCIETCNLVAQDSTEVYMELLCFVAENDKISASTYFRSIPLLKYTNQEGSVELCSISQIMKGKVTVKYALDPEVHSWLNMCNMKFGCFDKVYLLPNDTQKSLATHVRVSKICYWLSNCARVTSFLACEYAYRLNHYVKGDTNNLTILVAHFLYQAHMKNFIDESKIYDLCAKIPVIDGCGQVRKERNVTLVPASGSKWVKLFGPSNPYLSHYYIDIGDVYSKSGTFLGECTPDKVVLDFICKYSKAMDLPDLSPPNLELKIASSQLSIEQAFLLLDWIRLLRTKGFNIPERFKESFQNGKWMKTYTGYKSPRKSVLPNEMGKEMFVLMKHILKDISVIDQEFYSNKMSMYQGELRFLGVGFGFDDMQRLITAQFVSLASSGMRKELAFSLLIFIGFLKQRSVIDVVWLQAMKKGKWLKTHQGYNAPEGSVLLLSKIEAAFCLTTTDLLVVDEAHYGSQLGSFLSELQLLGVIIDFGESLKLIAEKASFPPNLPSVTADCGLLMLKCIKCSGPTATSLIERVRGQPWLKTTFGFKSPSETTFPNSRWDSLARALQIPTIDELYYGDELSYYLSELSATGVAVDTANIIEMIAAKFKYLSLSSKLGPDIVLSMLDCFKEMRLASSSRCSELQWLYTEKWLKTRHGYKAPPESIIFSVKWAAVSYFVDLPIIDDVFYSIVIYKYKDELQMLGVITDFEGGAGLVLEGLKSPIEPEFVTADGTMALLKCLKSAMSEGRDQSIPDSFLMNISKSKCLKTATGYLVPGECVLFSSAWDKILKQTDVPSIDIVCYESDISEYKEQLKAIGVKIDSEEVCSLISQRFFSQTETSLIKRLYNFLSQFNWKPEKLDVSNSRIWIPNLVGDGGKWVNSDFCIIRDKNDLFGSRLYSLSQFYKPELLRLFSSAFGVREFPSMGEYFQLWNDWMLSNDHQISDVECYFFWECISKFWKPETEENFRQQFTKVTATACLDDKIHLLNKELVFIPDDLRLKKIFASVSVPLFVWFPNSGSLSSALSRRLFEIYRSLGVKMISESVTRKVGSILTEDNPKNVIPKNELIEKGLIKIILAFLAGAHIEMPAKERQESAAALLNLSLYKSEQPIKVTYCLTPYPNETVKVETKKLVLWDKNSKCLVIDRSGYEDRKNNIEFGSCFAQEISEGLVPEGRELAVAGLSRIIHMGFMYEFKEDSVDYLLVKENLELFVEDIEFLGAAFMGTKQSVKRTVKSEHVAPSTPLPPCKKLCRSVP
ncbi:Histidine kinase-like ATPase, C-terminal domain containing protein [Trema orientale]|uniref:Histidine kinase-like ATPase, C-terminal domain containing protein n=1 Tax=Trema orientale TaxID=63057 RepID=A0A2P5G124_TREOI|nr:Histidine kinase-like ATPase, C-terminal domain containing protein [Trema orientale]